MKRLNIRRKAHLAFSAHEGFNRVPQNLRTMKALVCFWLFYFHYSKMQTGYSESCLCVPKPTHCQCPDKGFLQSISCLKPLSELWPTTAQEMKGYSLKKSPSTYTFMMNNFMCPLDSNWHEFPAIWVCFILDTWVRVLVMTVTSKSGDWLKHVKHCNRNSPHLLS